jgi:Spy/CpxP family protein refolding chaperone
MMTIQKRTFIWIITALVALNIATIATIAYHIAASKSESEATAGNRNFGGRNIMPRGGRQMIEKLDFNDTQREQFNAINNNFRNSGREISAELNRLRQEMMDKMALDNPDTALLNQLSDSVGFWHSKLKRETYRYYLNINNICNRQQKDSLKRYFEDEFSNTPQMRMHQQGKRMGRRR